MSASAMTAHAGALTAPYPISTSQEGIPWDLAAGANGDQIVLLAGGTNPVNKLRYDSNGQPLGPGMESLGSSFGDAVAADRAGNHVVVGVVPGLPGIHARVYNRHGLLITPQFRVDTNASGKQLGPVVAMNRNGVIAVAWQNEISDTSQQVQLRLFNRDGTPRSAMATVASAGDRFISPGSIAMDGSNNVTLAWVQRNYSTPIGMNVFMRRYNGSGVALNAATRMNDSNEQAIYPNVATNTAGNALVATWSTHAPSTNSRVIMGQRYTSSGARIGGNFVVSNLVGNTMQQNVGMMDDGSFAVTWDNNNRYNVPTAIPAIYVKQYNSAGAPVGPDLLVTNANSPFGGHLAMDLAGNFTIAWQQVDPATQTSVGYARRYVMDTLPPVTPLQNNVAVSGLAGNVGTFRYFKFTVPPATPSFSLTMTGAGDADMLIRYAALPSFNAFDISPAVDGSNESVVVGSPPPGDFYVGLWGYSAYSDVTLKATY